MNGLTLNIEQLNINGSQVAEHHEAYVHNLLAEGKSIPENEEDSDYIPTTDEEDDSISEDYQLARGQIDSQWEDIQNDDSIPSLEECTCQNCQRAGQAVTSNIYIPIERGQLYSRWEVNQDGDSLPSLANYVPRYNLYNRFGQDDDSLPSLEASNYVSSSEEQSDSDDSQDEDYIPSEEEYISSYSDEDSLSSLEEEDASISSTDSSSLHLCQSTADEVIDSTSFVPGSSF